MLLKLLFIPFFVFLYLAGGGILLLTLAYIICSYTVDEIRIKESSESFSDWSSKHKIITVFVYTISVSIVLVGFLMFLYYQLGPNDRKEIDNEIKTEQSEQEDDVGSENNKNENQITQAPSPSTTKTPAPEPTIVPTPTPTPTPEEPYCGIWVSATDYLDGGSNKVGNEWTITHYASFDGTNYVEVPYGGSWYSVNHPVTLYVKTVIVEDDKYPDEATNKYSIDIDTDKSLTSSGSYWTINQWTDVVENNGAYRGNSCTWNTDWTITFLYN